VADASIAEAVLTAAIYQADTGRELRIGFTLTNLIHSELSRTTARTRRRLAPGVHRARLDRTAHDQHRTLIANAT